MGVCVFVSGEELVEVSLAIKEEGGFESERVRKEEREIGSGRGRKTFTER